MTVDLSPTQPAQIKPAQHVASQESSRLITGEELYAMGDIGRVELVEGKLVKMSPTGHLHGKLVIRIGSILLAYADQYRTGEVFGGEMGIYTGRNPDTTRGADVAFVSNERMAQVQSQSYLDVAPELVVEVMSPTDRWQDVMDKLSEYFAIGVQVIWIVQPKSQEVYAYRSLTEIEHLTASDQLTCEDVLPGFSVPVGQLFGIKLEDAESTEAQT